MKKLLNFSIAALVATALCVGGCSGLPANATAQQKAQHAIDSATTGVKFVVGPAVTAWLLMQKDVAKQQHDAAMVYAGAMAINSGATGAVLTPAELQNLIRTFTSADDPRYLQLAQLLSAEYAQLYPLFGIAGTTPVQFFTEVALQAGNAAKPFLARHAGP